MGKIDPEILRLLKSFKDSVKERYNITNMVFFGSRATGTAHEDSDIDLIVVVKEYDKSLVGKLMAEWHEKQHIDYPVDFIQCSKRRFDEMSKGINIVIQALKEGVVI